MKKLTPGIAFAINDEMWFMIPTSVSGLYKRSGTGSIKDLSEFLWRAVLFFLENPVEVRHVIEAAPVCHFIYGLSGFDEQT
jgi:hypothetical protein